MLFLIFILMRCKMHELLMTLLFKNINAKSRLNWLQKSQMGNRNSQTSQSGQNYLVTYW